MAYPRTTCPTCERDVAVYPVALKVNRHDPASGRTEDLRSCPGSFARWQPGPGDPGYWGDEPTLFEIQEA